jgi:hypothetical protein
MDQPSDGVARGISRETVKLAMQPNDAIVVLAELGSPPLSSKPARHRFAETTSPNNELRHN